MKCHTICCIAVLLLFYWGNTRNVVASTDTIGPNGINSAGLGLIGNGVLIGQVEPFRPGKPGYDMGANCCDSTVVPSDVFVHDRQALMDERIDDYSLAVVGIFISKETTAIAR
jgi:hypothetical protein